MSSQHERAPLSVCVICLNEAQNIVDCLRSVEWADDIVVVDSGSTDGTVELARQFTDRVVFHEWIGCVQQREYSVSLARHDWVLCMDADERISEALAEEIRDELRRIAAGDARADGFTIPRRVRYLGRWIRWGGWYPDRKLRFFRKAAGHVEGVNPHDHIRVDGRALPLRHDMYHLTYRDIADHVNRMNTFTSVAAGEKRTRGQRWAFVHMLLNPPGRFMRMYFLKLGFLDGRAGFINAVLGAFYVFLKYAKLWEMRQDSAPEPPSGGGEADR